MEVEITRTFDLLEHLVVNHPKEDILAVKRNGKHGYFIYDPDVPVANTEEDIDRDLSRVIQIMSERGEGKGAMILGQEAFSWNYRFIIRFLKRYGGHANRILFRISADENKVVFP